MPVSISNPITPEITTSAAPSRGLLDIHPVEFEKHFARQPFLIQHHLCDHPLFQVDRILKLAQTLDERCIEYNAGNIPVQIENALTPRNGLSPAETIRRIAECQSWMVLKYVERDGEYGALLNDCLDLVRPFSEPIAPGMTKPQAFIFLTSPGSTTPYHIDPEHNFLLQIRGSKEVHLLDGRDRSIVTEADLEQFYCDRGRNLKVSEEKLSGGWVYTLQPGQGLHFPVTYPHWVKNGPEVSVSFSITFRTPDLDRRRALYQMNDRLRRLGVNPTPVGQSPLRDWALFNTFRILRRLGHA